MRSGGLYAGATNAGGSEGFRGGSDCTGWAGRGGVPRLEGTFS
jgi:hypothetical protein